MDVFFVGYDDVGEVGCFVDDFGDWLDGCCWIGIIECGLYDGECGDGLGDCLYLIFVCFVECLFLECIGYDVGCEGY